MKKIQGDSSYDYREELEKEKYYDRKKPTIENSSINTKIKEDGRDNQPRRL